MIGKRFEPCIAHFFASRQKSLDQDREDCRFDEIRIVIEEAVAFKFSEPSSFSESSAYEKQKIDSDGSSGYYD
jgi:hypothetical protein